MKRKVCLLLAVIMVFSLAGCGGGGSDSGSGSAGKPPANIIASPTKNLEEEYQKRMALYQEYYEKEKSGNSKYEIGGVISLDGDGLPVMWLAFMPEGGSKKDVASTQLVGVKDGKAEVLAERRCSLAPRVGSRGITALEYGNDKEIFLYDSEKQDFITVKDFRSVSNFSDFSEEDAETAVKYLPYTASTVMIARGDDGIIDIGGYAVSDDVYDALANLGLVVTVQYDKDGGYIVAKRKGVSYKVVTDFWDKLEDAGITLEDTSMSAISTAFDSELKKVPKVAASYFYFQDGSSFPAKSSVLPFLNNYVFTSGYEFVGRSNYEFIEHLEQIEFERMLRDLQKNPAYTWGDLYCMVYSTFGGKEVSDFRLEDLKASEFDDNLLLTMVADYCTGEPYFDFYFSDELKKKHDSFVKDEKIKSLMDQGAESEYDSSTKTLTVKTKDGNEWCKIKFGLSDSGDKIASIEVE